MLTPKQRIAVARDVIKQVETERFLARNEGYLHIGGEDIMRPSGISTQGFCKKLKNCTVCAKGALFVSSIAKYNNYEVKKTVSSSKFIRSKTREDWGRYQADLIECAYEQSTAFIKSCNLSQEDEVSRAVSFGKKYDKAPSRLIAIMNNIIRNNGTFKP
jgi:hypothetical protein